MNTAWKKVKIEEVADFINGGAWGENEYTNDGIGVLKVSNLQNSGIDYSNISFLSNESLSKYARHQLKIDDLVIATVGSHPSLINSSAGRATIIPKQANGYLLNQNAVCLRTKNDEVLNQKFLAYTGKTVDFQHFIQQRGKGAANQMRIAIGGIKEFELPIPPLETQTQIANILSAYDDLIENNLRRIKLLEEMAELTYREWFVNFKIDGKTLEIDKNTGLPFGWERKSLVEVANLVMGQSPESKYYNEDKNGLPFHQGVTGYGLRFPSNSTWSEFGQRSAEKGDILFSVRAPVGRLNISSEKILIGRGLSAIRHNSGNNSFLFYQLKNLFFKDDLMGGGAIFNSVTKKEVENISVIEPQNEVLKKFNQHVIPIDSQIINLSHQNRLLKESRDILLPRLMNGEVGV